MLATFLETYANFFIRIFVVHFQGLWYCIDIDSAKGAGLKKRGIVMKIDSAAAAAAGLVVERGSYSGQPTLSIRRGAGDRYPFTFGLAKAKMMIAMVEEIKAFVADCEAAATVTAVPAITPPPSALSVEALKLLLAQAEAKEAKQALPSYGKRRVKNVASRAARV
jgi:hypothetical protein